ncbi:hypothetical protein IWQ62_004427 [Dispira parvispora]|uniref:BED-type domain-containing protein n=1 Tax=Dispira parvispora TaxID=1520584 RepID=A0A9W8E656_9FUNG|nr:hypothetical protein IWQ62_004427 [Dispira parvispora]
MPKCKSEIWEFFEVVPKSTDSKNAHLQTEQYRCKFCGSVRAKNASRFIQHIATSCDKAPQEVVERVSRELTRQSRPTPSPEFLYRPVNEYRALAPWCTTPPKYPVPHYTTRPDMHNPPIPSLQLPSIQALDSDKPRASTYSSSLTSTYHTRATPYRRPYSSSPKSTLNLPSLSNVVPAPRVLVPTPESTTPTLRSQPTLTVPKSNPDLDRDGWDCDQLLVQAFRSSRIPLEDVEKPEWVDFLSRINPNYRVPRVNHLRRLIEPRPMSM